MLLGGLGIFVLCTLVVHSSTQENNCKRVYDLISGTGYLELMNSPKLTSKNLQTLRVVFEQNRLPGDKVRVIQESPGRKIIFEVNVPLADYIDTNKVNNENYKYSAEYIRSNGTVVARSLLADWKGWMFCMHEFLGSRSIGKVMIPGTHDAGAYTDLKKSFKIPLVESYLYTQDETIERQLERGARYLDLRIGRYPRLPIINNEIWWINHGVFKIRPLIKIVNQIKRFLSRYPNEIIILDLHGFPVGFENARTHDDLAKFFIDQFGPLLYRPKNVNLAWDITFNELWKTPARILLSYNNYDIAAKYNLLPPIDQLWANTDVESKLYDFMDKSIPKTCSTTKMTSAMAQLTPKDAGVISNKYGGLRNLAHNVNAKITLGFAKGHWGQTAQAVAVDFLSSTGIISAAILQNVERTNPNHICY